MQLSQPLFLNLKGRLFFLTILLCIFCATLSFKAYQFHILKTQKNQQVNAEVLLQYTKTKKNKTYSVLKLQSDFGIFYTTTYEDLKDIQYRQISLRVIIDKLTFWEFLGGFYAPSFNIILLRDESLKQDLRNFILKQHTTSLMGEYYLALFLSDALPKEWRDLAQSYGIAHIFAISGFHTGILSVAGLWILGFLYKPLHRRFFPFRNFFFDIGIVVMVLLVAYYFLLTNSPSYLRAVVMSVMAFVLYWRRIELLSLETLFWCVAILLAIFPALMFSVGFYFSALGVLYILLFFKYFQPPKGYFNRFLYGSVLNASTFFLMGVVVYYFFPPFSPLSLLSLILTPLFVLYYPFVLVAHLVGFGGILDSILLWWVQIPTHTITLQVNIYWFILCNFLSICAFFYRAAFFILLFVNLGFFGFGLYLYF